MLNKNHMMGALEVKKHNSVCATGKKFLEENYKNSFVGDGNTTDEPAIYRIGEKVQYEWKWSITAAK